jgi:hypothetical protein
MPLRNNIRRTLLRARPVAREITVARPHFDAKLRRETSRRKSPLKLLRECLAARVGTELRRRRERPVRLHCSCERRPTGIRKRKRRPAGRVGYRRGDGGYLRSLTACIGHALLRDLVLAGNLKHTWRGRRGRRWRAWRRAVATPTTKDRDCGKHGPGDSAWHGSSGPSTRIHRKLAQGRLAASRKNGAHAMSGRGGNAEKVVRIRR